MPMMPIITLTTDFGLKDASVAAVKGAIYSELNKALIVDITHEVSPFHISEAAYIIRNAYRNFPKGSIHILGVDSELTPENEHIAVKLDGHYFICANNGIISLLTNEMVPEKSVKINIHDKVITNFPVLDIFVQVASHIARGGTLDVIGKSISTFKTLRNIEPVIKSNNEIIGAIIYIDNYGNAVSNISKKIFKEVAKARDFKITARGFQFNKIYRNYSDAINFELPKDRREEEGKRLALFNSSDYLEISIYKSNPETVGSASSLLGLRVGDSISVVFE